MEHQRLFQCRHFQVEIVLVYMRVFRESTQ
jgi:hypothetical protein